MLIDCIDCETAFDSLNARVFRTYPQYKMNKRVRIIIGIDHYWNKKIINICGELPFFKLFLTMPCPLDLECRVGIIHHSGGAGAKAK